jgi:hypothetical protein
MRFNRTSKLFWVLLLAALLPWRAYAGHCESGAGSPAAPSYVHDSGTHENSGTRGHAHCFQHQIDPGPASPFHVHGCADCCAALATLESRTAGTLRPAPVAAPIARLELPSPSLTLDRIDRPPRRAL